MLRPKLLALALAALAAPAGGHAQVARENFDPKTARDLVALCSAPETSPTHLEAIGFCHGFGRGAIDFYRSMRSAAARPLFCPGNAVMPPAQVRTEYVAWAQAVPARLEERPADSVFRFLMDRFPCPQGTTR